MQNYPLSWDCYLHNTPAQKRHLVFLFFCFAGFLYPCLNAISIMRQYHLTIIPRRSQGLLYKHRCNSFIKSLTQSHQIAYSSQRSPAVKDELCFESQQPLKNPFLTAISKIYRPTKIEKRGTWQANILFRNLRRIFLPWPRR